MNKRKLWRELHRFAHEECLIPERAQQRSGFIAAWLARMPEDCPCKAFWREYVATHPLPPGSPEFFWWTIVLHDAVNAKLGRPKWWNGDVPTASYVPAVS